VAQYVRMGGSFSTVWSTLVDNVQKGIQTYGPRALLVLVVFTTFFLLAQFFKLYSNRSFDVNLYR
jgi:hypothetical protein